MMNCIIIEDQLPAQRILKKYIDDTKSLHLIGAYTDAIEAIDILNTENIDLLFLDIHLPKLSGIDFLKSLSNPPKTILTTAFTDYALESYELNVVDYLLKPFSFQRFIKAIAKANTMPEKPSKVEITKASEIPSNAIFIKSGYEHIRIEIENILFLKSDADYIEIHLNDKKHLSADSLSSWEERLPPKDFARIHKSYIINTKQIIKISGNQVYLKENITVPIGRAYKNDFIERYLS